MLLQNPEYLQALIKVRRTFNRSRAVLQTYSPKIAGLATGQPDLFNLEKPMGLYNANSIIKAVSDMDTAELEVQIGRMQLEYETRLVAKLNTKYITNPHSLRD